MLISAFIVLGTVVYQITASPSDPTRASWSFAGMIQKVRREVSGNQASAKTRTTETVAAPDSLRELRIVMRTGAITVIGEDREDVEITLNVTSTGYDSAEAERLSKATALKLDEAGALLIASVDYPVEGRQTSTLDIRVPKRLVLRVDEKSGVLTAKDIAGVVLGAARGETNISGVAGLVQVTQRGGVISVSDVETLRLNTFSGAEARIARVRGAATFTLQRGELRAEEVNGAIELESTNADVRLEKLDKNRNPIRLNVTNGEVVLEGLQTETRIDARDADIRVDQPRAAPLSIYNDGDESIELTVPGDGFKLDAISAEGRLTADAALASAGLKIVESGGDGEATAVRHEFRANAAIRGGGPTITLRATRGDIVLRSR
ncbi:MAG: DUF4097 family beta strand repeat-containing protein [Vicinamibacterales bacterium]